MAAQLGDDLLQFVAAGEVAVFPAWETLPFERVSPSVETMGQRLELLWRFRPPPGAPPRVVPRVRAVVGRLGARAGADRAATGRPAPGPRPPPLAARPPPGVAPRRG